MNQNKCVLKLNSDLIWGWLHCASCCLACRPPYYPLHNAQEESHIEIFPKLSDEISAQATSIHPSAALLEVRRGCFIYYG